MITTLTRSNVRDILPLLRQVQDLHAGARPDLFRSDWDEVRALEDLAAQIDAGAVVLVDRDGAGTPRGYLAYQILSRPETALKKAETFALLDVIAVDAACRRQGIARGLVSAMKTRLSDSGIPFWRVSYHAFNDTSAALMAAMGAVPAVVFAQGRVS